MRIRPSGWPPPLRWLLPIGFAALVLAVSAVELALSRWEVRRNVERNLRGAIATDLALASEALEYYSRQGAMDRIRQKLALAALRPQMVGGFLLSTSGVVVAATRLDCVGADSKVAWSSLGMSEPALARELFANPARDELPHVEIDGDIVWGAISVSVPTFGPTKRLSNTEPAWLVEAARVDTAFAQVLAGAQFGYGAGMGLAVVVALVVAGTVRGTFVRRIAGLVKVTERLRGGDLEARAGLRGSDEVADLGVAFDAMAAQLAADRQQLSQSEARFRQIYERASDAILLLDGEGRILDSNPGGALLFRRSREDLLTRSLRDLMEREPDERGDGPALPDSARALVERRFRRADGTVAEVELASSTLPDGRVIAVLRDLTERRALQERMGRSERLASIGTLAAGVAHEMNNPLSYVLGNLELATERLRDMRGESAREEILEALAEAQQGARRMAAVVRDMRAFTRVDDAAVEPVDLAEVTRVALKLTGPSVRHQASVTTRLEPTPLVTGNEGRLVQVVTNLIVNAGQAMDDGRTSHELHVETGRTEAGEAQLIVRDSGSGIAPEVLPRIFDPFVTTKPVGVGTGLGLWVCHDVVSSLGGRIDVDSTVGRGTTFTVTLPAAAPRNGAAAPPAAAPSLGCDGLRVLVIDDEPLVARVLARALRGATVDVAHGGGEGLALLREGVYDVVVCDLHMPGVDGASVLEWLERERPALAARTLIASGGATSERARAVLERLGEERVIHKPVEAARFREIVARAAGRAAA